MKLLLLVSGTWEQLLQDFDYSKVLVNWGGQGTYYKPEFCINGVDTVTDYKRHSTKVIEDDCIDWLESRDEDKPFMLLYQFKAPHRDWRPDSMCTMILFTDFDFPIPENFNDDYNGRIAAGENMMEIENHLNRRGYETIAARRVENTTGFNEVVCLW